MSAEVFKTPSAPRDNLSRRKAVNRLMEALATLAALIAVTVLVVVVVSVALEGAPAVNLDFVTKAPNPAAAFGFSETPIATGIANAIVGTLVLVAFATLMALPIGILIAIYLNEFARRRIASGVAMILDVLNGIPSIVIGIFVFGLFVVAAQQYRAIYASFALAIIMVPLVARATQEVLALVPNSIREASLALGVSRWRTTLSVVLPQTLGGILTGTTLAIARVAGETAPLLFTTAIGTSLAVDANPLNPLEGIPTLIFKYSESPTPQDQEQAWAAALLLILAVLVLSLGARALATRSLRKQGLIR